MLKDENGNAICDLNDQGNVIVDLKMRTNIPGLFAAGDLRIDAPKQVVSAAGDGAVAGVNVITYIDNYRPLRQCIRTYVTVLISLLTFFIIILIVMSFSLFVRGM